MLVTDAHGKRFLAKLGNEMVTIKTLGTVKGELLRESLRKGYLSIGDRRFSVRIASVDDIISVIQRKAQMLTAKDIAMMIHFGGVRCGSKVVEGGAGSGALSIALLSSVGMEGHLTTYELREDFADIARRNVDTASLSDNWTLKIGDICNEIEENEIDSFIVDIPNPWDCVGTAKKSLRIGGTFCAFVPNINQLESTVHALRQNDFTDIRAVETLQRDMIVHEGGVRPSCDILGHTGYLILARR